MKKLFLSMSLFFIGVFAHAQDSENIEEVVVIGTKASLKSAIDKQRSSQKIISVIDSDALGDFPDIINPFSLNIFSCFIFISYL